MEATAQRVTTGIPGLDPLLRGGLLAGGLYLVEGPSGSGKTILASQLCFHHARSVQRTVYFTLLTESHTRMLAHLRTLAFFEPGLIGEDLVFLSGFHVLEQEGLSGLARLLRSTVLERAATLMVIDGLDNAQHAASSPSELEKFLHELQTFTTNLGCTTVVLSNIEDGGAVGVGHTAADGVIRLSDELVGLRARRHIQLVKMRGTGQVRGKHTLEITERGITVHARFEIGLDRDRRPDVAGPERCRFGIRELDDMMMGGVPARSITMLLGASGVGKTLLALKFLAAGAEAGEKGLYFGMHEHPEALLAKCKRIHLGLQEGVDASHIFLTWQRATEGVLDVLANRLLHQLRATGAKRVCIDGMQSLFRTIEFPGRTHAVAAALMEELESLGVTTLYTLETSELVEAGHSPIRSPIDDISALSHNVIGLRYIERAGRLDRMLSIIKMRDSDHDRSIRELQITEHGLQLSRLSPFTLAREERQR